MNLLLIGPRGCGKSTIGPPLARAISYAFVDLDQRVQDCFEEASVSDIWATHGESSWRSTEAKMLEVSLGDDRQVIALGGGVPMIESARLRIEVARRGRESLVVYLHCEPDELRMRISQNAGDRPSLTGDDPISEIEAVLTAREPVYRAMADHQIESAGLTIEATVAQLREWFSQQCGDQEPDGA